MGARRDGLDAFLDEKVRKVHDRTRTDTTRSSSVARKACGGRERRGPRRFVVEVDEGGGATMRQADRGVLKRADGTASSNRHGRVSESHCPRERPPRSGNSATRSHDRGKGQELKKSQSQKKAPQKTLKEKTSGEEGQK